MATDLVIYSIAPESFLFRRTWTPGVTLPAKPENSSYSSLRISDVTDVRLVFTEYDWTKAEKIPVPITAQQIVDDFFQAEKLEQHGCFVKPAGELPTDEDLEKAQATRREWLIRLIQEGDKEYLATKRVDQIPDFCKRAVRELGEKREWAPSAPKRRVQCQACGQYADVLDSGLPPIMCICGYPLDRERAIAEGLWKPAKAHKEEAVKVS
jgi:hypothetical protein